MKKILLALVLALVLFPDMAAAQYNHNSVGVIGADGKPFGVANTDGKPQVVVDSSALPTDAATATNQTDGSQASQLVDENGTPYGVKHLDNKPRVVSSPYLYEIGKGNIPGHKAIHKFGYNGDVDTGGAGYEVVWSAGGTYPWQTAAEQMQVSAGANDTGALRESGTLTAGTADLIVVDEAATFQTNLVAAGDLFINDTQSQHAFVASVDSETQLTLFPLTDDIFTNVVTDSYRIATETSTGAGVIEIRGLDANYDEIMEHVILNGAVDVATTQSFLRVNRAYVVLAGSAGHNVAAVLIENNASAVVWAEIRAAISQTEMAIWTVPDGFDMFMVSFFVAESNNARQKVAVFARPEGGVFRPVSIPVSVVASSAAFEYRLPVVFGPRTDIEIRAIPDASNGKVDAAWEAWYE